MKYLVIINLFKKLQQLSPEMGVTTFSKGTVLTVHSKEHPLYNDIPHYYKNNIVKKVIDGLQYFRCQYIS